MSAPQLSIFIGTSSNAKPAPNLGIYFVSLDSVTGEFSPPGLAVETANPAFLAWHPGRPVLYSSGRDRAAPPDSVAGAANSYALDAATHRLTPLDSQATHGLAVTHLSVDATGQILATASFHGGQLASFPLLENGAVGTRASSIQVTGQLGPNKIRQDKPHPHSVTLSPDSRHAYACDLGRDRVMCFRLGLADGSLTPAGEFAASPGSGPRHSKCSADGRFLYVVNEIKNTIAVYARDATTGTLTARQVVETLPKDFTGTNTAAEIRIHPNGCFVYASNRGHDSVVVFSRQETEGSLAFVERVPCGGRTPRNFALSPDGTWLVCANLDDNQLTSLRLDPATGRLAATGRTVAVPSPTCVLFSGANS